MSYFDSIPPVRYEGPGSGPGLAYRHYNANEKLLGKTSRPASWLLSTWISTLVA